MVEATSAKLPARLSAGVPLRPVDYFRAVKTRDG